MHCLILLRFFCSRIKQTSVGRGQSPLQAGLRRLLGVKGERFEPGSDMLSWLKQRPVPGLFNADGPLTLTLSPLGEREWQSPAKDAFSPSPPGEKAGVRGTAIEL